MATVQDVTQSVDVPMFWSFVLLPISNGGGFRSKRKWHHDLSESFEKSRFLLRVDAKTDVTPENRLKAAVHRMILLFS